MGCCREDKKVNDIELKEINQAAVEFEGPVAERSCRDVIFLLIFIAYLGGMGYVSYLGIHQGNPYRIVYGVDSWGNVCSQKNDKIAGVALSGIDMTHRTKKFYLDQTYFASVLSKSITPSFSDSTTTVLCVAECPSTNLSFSELQAQYDATGIHYCIYNVTPYVMDTEKCPVALLPHVSILNRCIPEYIIQITKGMATSFTSVLSGVTLGGNVPQKIFSDVKNSYNEILILCGIAAGIALLVVILMQFLAAVIVWTLVFMVVVLCLGATAYSCIAICLVATCFFQSRYVISFVSFYWILKWITDPREPIVKLLPFYVLNGYVWRTFDQLYKALPAAEQTDEAKQKVQTWLIYASIASGISAIVLLVLLVLRSRIALVIQLFKEAGSALRKMPLLLLQPIWTLAITLASAAGLILIATFIETSGLPVKNSDGHVKYVMEALWTYLRWYHYFGILWITAFILACQDLVVAGAVAIWYFKRDKSKLGCPICRSTQRLIRYHLGSVAFGSFIIALVRFVRLVLAYIQNKLKGRTSKIVDLMLKMLQCCLWCFEKFLQYINRNAYIEIAIYGKSFCESARKAFILIVNNALRVVAINSVGDFVLFIGKLCTVGVVLVVGHELLKNRDDINYIWAPISIACAFAFAISHCFMVVYEIAIDTIFICFCEDCERNDGVTKPFFMSKNLMEFLDSSAKAEMKKKSSEKKSNKAANV